VPKRSVREEVSKEKLEREREKKEISEETDEVAQRESNFKAPLFAEAAEE